MDISVVKSLLTFGNLVRAVRNPPSAWRHFRWAVMGYGHLARALGVSEGQFQRLVQLVERDTAFTETLWAKIRPFDDLLRRQGISGGAGLLPRPCYGLIYTVMRAVRPSIVIETGVASGMSTSYILRALYDNAKGELFSIDLPDLGAATPTSTPIPSGAETGWVVPSELKGRWHLLLGRSQELLPSLLQSLGQVDAFLHDSDHTYANHMFECETVWPYLGKGGVLCSECWAFLSEFGNKVKVPMLTYGNFGIMVKGRKALTGGHNS